MKKKKNGIERIKSGIKGFDKLIEGGFVKGSVNLLLGGSGSGKTIFSLQFLLQGLKNNENCAYIALDEKKETILKNAKAFGWNLEEFVKKKVPAVTFAASNSLITKNREVQNDFFVLLESYLEQGLFPVTFGDVIVDNSMGCTIWSTESILGFLTEKFTEKNYIVEKIIHLTEVTGFLNQDQEVLPEITNKNWPELKKMLTKTRGADVTGGMKLKIEESLQLAEKYGVSSHIISGKNGNLFKLLVEKQQVGTKIS